MTVADIVATLKNMAASRWADTYEWYDVLTQAHEVITSQAERIRQLEASRNALLTEDWVTDATASKNATPT